MKLARALSPVVFFATCNLYVSGQKGCSSNGEFKEVDRDDCPSRCGFFVSSSDSGNKKTAKKDFDGRHLRSAAHALQVLSRGLEGDDGIEAAGKEPDFCLDCECCDNCVGACCAYSEEEERQMCYEDVTRDHCENVLEGTYIDDGSTCDDEGPAQNCGATACGESCHYDDECNLGCCIKPSYLDFGMPERRQLSAEEGGQCGEKKWCDCNSKFGGDDVNDVNLFLRCMNCPFVCKEAKPIDKLVMRLVEPVAYEGIVFLSVFVRAFNNDKCEGEILHQSTVDLEQNFRIVAPSDGKLNKDILWCIYENKDTNVLIAASKFHISCSDDNLKDDEACGERQGGGKKSGGKKGKGSRRSIPLFDGWKLVKMSGSGAKGGGVRLSLNCEPMDLSES